MNKTESEINYIACPECSGNGQQLEAHGYPDGYREVLVTCEFCEGEGWFNEADYIIMKLAGEV